MADTMSLCWCLCLQAMFSLCMVESEADEVTLQGVTGVGLKHALDFAYTGQVSTRTRQHSRPNQPLSPGALLGYVFTSSRAMHPTL